jgi:biotin carboxylase
VTRVLLLLPATSYRNEDFLAAGQALGVEIVAAADYCEQLAPLWGMNPMLALPFAEPEKATAKALAYLDRNLYAVLAVDDQGLEVAALIAERLGLPGNAPDAVRTLRDKLAFRGLQRRIGLPHPAFRHLPEPADAAALASALDYPVVVKARRLAASRGVIRADDAAQFVRAAERVRAIQRRADRDAAALGLVVERFVPGSEHAVEGLLTDGRLDVLALFDKPDPLDGPYFEETLYVTPSRLPAQVQRAIAVDVERACRAAGVVTGPVHAEMRVTGDDIVLIEVAARSIGGLCGRVLRHGLGISLEELILRHALGLALPANRTGAAAGVMMVPIPARGILTAVVGVDAARSVPRIEDVVISAAAGELVVPAPDGGAYLGFIFARADTPEETEAALRTAYAQLQFELRPEIPLEAWSDARDSSKSKSRAR